MTSTIYMQPAEEVNGTTGYDVIDSRTGEALAWRGTATSAAEIVDYLNSTYEMMPAYDTLVHEIIGLRITGVAG
jgi:hypothetical protein